MLNILVHLKDVSHYLYYITVFTSVNPEHSFCRTMENEK
nr:MAG TPA: hypothetical protein [Caudoviricetes sp.]